ncbi:MAG: radical SAM protein [Candidatus Bathyarchaeia archaeon]
MCGYKVVLTADETLMCNYGGNVFLGFMTTGPVSGFKPFNMVMNFLLKPISVDYDGRALTAPLSLRIIESVLIDSNVVKPDEIVVTHPKTLPKVVSEETRIIGVSVMDPKGLGPASSTFSGPYGLVHSDPYSAYMFKKLIRSEVVQKARKWASLVVGGSGAWQLNADDMGRLGIDVLFIGEAEEEIPRLFRRLIEDGRPEKPTIVMANPSRSMPRIKGATVCGLIEISRGCGRGCRFCTPTMRILRHKPLEDILHDVKVNVEAGQRNICLHAEDVLQYGGTAFKKRPDLVFKLFSSVIGIDGVGFVSMSHAALSSIAENPRLISDISEILGLTRNRWLGYQTGIETGSARLIDRLMHMKPYPFTPKEWPNVVEDAFKISSDCNWTPAATLMLNLPGEEPEDVLATADLVDRLKPYKSLIVPLLYVPMVDSHGHKARRLLEDADDAYWQLYHAVWRHNMKWIPVIAKEYLGETSPKLALPIKFFISFVKNVVNPLIELKLSHIKTLEVMQKIET